MRREGTTVGVVTRMYPPPMLQRVSSRRGIDDDVESCFVPTTPSRVQLNEGDDDNNELSWLACPSIDHWPSPPLVAGHAAADIRPSPHGDAERPSDITATSSMWSCDGSVAHTIISVAARPGDSLPGGGATSIASSNVTPKTRNRKAILRPGITASLVASIFDPFANQQRTPRGGSWPHTSSGSNVTNNTPVAEQTQLVTSAVDRLDLAMADEPREQPSISAFDGNARDDAEATYNGPEVPQRATKATTEANEAEIRRSMRSEARQLYASSDGDSRKEADLSFAQKYWWAFVVAAILIVGICISMTLIVCFVGHSTSSPAAVTSRTTTAPSPAPTSRAL